jgi:hypothetical protein
MNGQLHNKDTPYLASVMQQTYYRRCKKRQWEIYKITRWLELMKYIRN